VAANISDKLLRWSLREEYAPRFADVVAAHISGACEAFGVEIGDLENLVGDPLLNLHGWLQEDFLVWPSEDGVSIIDDYLRRRGLLETATTRAYLTALKAAPVSLYEVAAVRPGEGMTLRDLLLGGEPFDVTERSGSRLVKRWDCLAMRAVAFRGQRQLGGAILPISRDLAPDLVLELQEACETAKDQMSALWAKHGDGTEPESLSMAMFLTTAAPIISGAWLGFILSRALGHDSPEFITSDGQPLELSTMSYSLRPKVTKRAVRNALDGCEALTVMDDDCWSWLKAGGLGRTEEADPREGLVVETWVGPRVLELAAVRLDGRKLLVEAKSAERAAAIRDLLSKALDGLVSAPIIAVTTREDLKEQRRLRAQDASPRPAVGSMEESPEAADVVRQYLDSHYLAQLDDGVPMLGGKTPRALSRTAEGREILIPWLKGLDNSVERLGLGVPYDTTWIWEELEMLAYRK